MRQTSAGPDRKDLPKDGEGGVPAALPASSPTSPHKIDSGGQASIDRMTATTLADLESMRLLLSGGSVIDWHQLAFSDAHEVRRFLRVNEFDPDDPLDMDRLEELRAEAVEYLTRSFNYRIPEDIAETTPVQDLLLIASQRGRHQTYACIVLKVMHVLNHLDGREALFRLPVSDDQLFGLVEAKVVKIVDEMRGAGLPIVEFAWSRKERDSLITKLLAKRDSIAAHVYDKLRFRLITKRREDLGPVLRELLCRLVPFNYVIPGQSINRLLPFDRLFETYPSLRQHIESLQAEEEINLSHGALNEFSARSYRVINFVADLPLRLSTVLRELQTPCTGDSGFDPRAVVFVLTEFQVMDAATALTNEQGDASHAVYKERQHIEVKARLTRGMKSRPTKSQPG